MSMRQKTTGVLGVLALLLLLLALPLGSRADRQSDRDLRPGRKALPTAMPAAGTRSAEATPGADQPVERRFAGSVADGETRSYTIKVLPGQREVRARLAWKSASPTEYAYLLLELVEPDGTTTYLADAGSAGDTGLQDGEEVAVLRPVPGCWTVRVQGSSVNGKQDFNLAVSPSVGAVIYVDSTVSGGNGSSWAMAYDDLQEALSAAVATDEIWVAEGTYKPSLPGGRDSTFSLVAGVDLYGGFPVGGGTRAPVAHETVLSGDIGVINDISDNCYHVVTAANNLVIDGFTFTRGNADGTGADSTRRAGAIYVDGTNPTIRNCKFQANYARYGGAIQSRVGAFPVIENCLFVSNSAWKGAAIQCDQCSATIRNCTFTGNSATEQSGGLHCSLGAMVTVENCAFLGNIAGNEAGGAFVDASSLSCINCTFGGNASARGGALFNNGVTLTLTNCIVWGNVASNSGSGIYNAGSTTVNYTCIQGGWGGTGNISSDPLFADLAGGDCHLKSKGGRWTAGGWVVDTVHSPCVDAGDPSSAYANEPLPNGSRVNMGAYGNTAQASKSAPSKKSGGGGGCSISGSGSAPSVWVLPYLGMVLTWLAGRRRLRK